MTEEEFTEILLNKLQAELNGVTVTKHENLLYKVIVNEKGEFQPSKPEKPARGSSDFAFQTDILVKDEEGIPLVVVEVKIRRLITHAVLTYSAKATQHKEIYPYLRYGLVIGEFKNIPNRFFTHNIGFDFALAINDVNNDDLSEFVNLIKSQVNSAKALLGILKAPNTTKMYTTKVEISSV